MLKVVITRADRELWRLVRMLPNVSTEVLCDFVERAIDELDARTWDSDYEPNADYENDLAEDGYRSQLLLLAGGAHGR